MIPHLIDLICRAVSLVALAWAVFSMGFASAERKTSPVRHHQSDEQQQADLGR